MTQNFLNALSETGNLTRTENDAVAYASTQSAVLDFFSQGGAIRKLPASEQKAMFARAWNENPELALKAMFYFRDVRGGQGQRVAFRNQLSFLADVAPSTVRKNLVNIPEYGRFDDLYALDGTPLEREVYDYMKEQFRTDLAAVWSDKHASLLAKWLKSENASSPETKRLATKTRTAFGMSARNYRKALSEVREYIRVLERQLSYGDWENIEYSHVPSRAMMKYRKAFRKHDEVGFGEFIDKVNTGEAKINVATLYPYEIVGRILGYGSTIRADEAQAMWDNLPNYMETPENSIVVVDTSGSMHGVPIQVAVSLGMYMAERARGPYKDHFITFSNRPKLQKIVGENIVSKVQGLYDASWEMNTNIEAVFDLILKTAVLHGISQEDMVEKLYIISDMEFDNATTEGWDSTVGAPDVTLFQTIADKFERKGYKMPNIVFWNVDARNVQFPMKMDERGFQNVSGFSPSILEYIMGGEFLSAYDMMLRVLESDRYAKIKV